MVIYGTNIGANHKQKQLKFFFYRVPLKSILKYIFYWKYFFHSDSTCPRIAEKTLTPFLTLPLRPKAAIKDEMNLWTGLS